MKYPALVTDKAKLFNNVQTIRALCAEAGVDVCVVTKCFCADPEITDVIYKAGIRTFADSRIANLKKIAYNDVTKWLLRLPMHSEVEDVVRYSDISLNSEISTIQLLSEAAKRIGKRHKVILMIDVGDLREGVLVEEAEDYAASITRFNGVELVGVGVNTNCFGGVIPTETNLGLLVSVAEKIESRCGIRLEIISGGNSGSVYLVANKNIPKRINNLRLGEVILMGVETSYQNQVAGLERGVFTLETQIIELREKPSVPIGETGLNSFGEKTKFVDRGNILRAIVACGRQDVALEHITPVDKDITILGSSSDHMILDISKSTRTYSVGGIVGFDLSYGSLLSLATSEYVWKETR